MLVGHRNAIKTLANESWPLRLDAIDASLEPVTENVSLRQELKLPLFLRRIDEGRREQEIEVILTWH